MRAMAITWLLISFMLALVYRAYAYDVEAEVGVWTAHTERKSNQNEDNELLCLGVKWAEACSWYNSFESQTLSLGSRLKYEVVQGQELSLHYGIVNGYKRKQLSSPFFVSNNTMLMVSPSYTAMMNESVGLRARYFGWWNDGAYSVSIVGRW